MAKIYYGNQEISNEQYIDSEHLDDNAVTTSKVQDGAITENKLSADVQEKLNSEGVTNYDDLTNKPVVNVSVESETDLYTELYNAGAENGTMINAKITPTVYIQTNTTYEANSNWYFRFIPYYATWDFDDERSSLIDECENIYEYTTPESEVKIAKLASGTIVYNGETKTLALSYAQNYYPAIHRYVDTIILSGDYQEDPRYTTEYQELFNSYVGISSAALELNYEVRFNTIYQPTILNTLLAVSLERNGYYVVDAANGHGGLSFYDVLDKSKLKTINDQSLVGSGNIEIHGPEYTAGSGLNLNGTEFSIDETIVATKSDLQGKQDVLTAGSNIIINNNEISATDTTYSAGNGLNLNGTEFSVDSTIATKQELAEKQDILTTGANIDINNNVISAIDTTYSAAINGGLVLNGTEFSVDTTVIATQQDLAGKQDVLTEGSNIHINNNVISADNTTYTAAAGGGLTLDGNNAFSVDTTVIATQQDLAGKQDVLTAGANITIDSNNEISATDTTYSAGNGLNLNGTEFSVDTTIIATQQDLTGKQDGLTAGTNIQINNNVITATDTTYSAAMDGGLTLDNNNAFSVDTTVIATQNGLSNKMDKANPTGTGSLSINRKANTTIGVNSVAVGENNTASGDGSHAEGASNEASGTYSHAEGSGTAAKGYSSHAEGNGSATLGDNSHAEGNSTRASGNNSHAEGYQTIAYADTSHAEGHGTRLSSRKVTGNANATTYTINDISDIFAGCIISYHFNYAQILNVNSTNLTITLDKTLSETQALSSASVIITTFGIASAYEAHSENNSAAVKSYSHSEGYHTIAAEYYAHAEGKETIADGKGSHSEGKGTRARRSYQHVFGEYNEIDAITNNSSNPRGDGEGTYIEIVGNGTADSARANARTLDWSGNEWLAGNLQFKSNSSTYKTTLQPSNLSTASADVTFTLPSDNGTSGQVLATDGSGNTSWQSTVNSLGGSTGAITFGPPLPALSAEFVVNANNQIVRNLHLYQHSIYVTATSVDCSLSFTFISTTSTPINIASALISVINAWLGTSTNGEGLAANGIYKVATANHQQIFLIKGQGEGATSLKLVMFNSTGTVAEHDLSESAITSVVDKVLIII